MTQSPGESELFARSDSRMPPRLPTAPEIVITTEIYAVDKDIKEVESKISRVEAALDWKGVYLGISDPDKLFMELQQLRDKEKLLLEDKKQLLDLLVGKEKRLRDKEKQLPSSGGVFQELLDFSEKLTKVTSLADNVLRLRKDVFFLSERLLESELFVRQCYVDLEDIIFDLVLHGRRSVIVSGTPGTGKNVFALYLLYQLRLQSKTVIVQSKDNWYRFSDEDGVQMWGSREAISISYLNDENAWFLCDPKEKQ